MKNNQHGFTLIEVLVALVILMVGLLGLLQSINLAMDKSMETVYRNEASVVANELIQSVGVAGEYKDITNTGASPAWRLVKRYPRGIFKNYSVQTVISQLTTAPLDVDGTTKLANTDSKQIDVNVHWTVKGRRYSHSASTIISTSNAQ